MNIRKKYYIWLSLLFVVVFFIWVFFYIYIIGIIHKNAQMQFINSANQVMDGCENELHTMEQIAFTLSQSTAVKNFVTENDIETYYLQSTVVNDSIAGSVSAHAVTGSVIIYNNEGVFYRFKGSQGNTACTRIFHLIDQTKSYEQLVAETEDTMLIGFCSGIYDSDGKRTGSVVVLADKKTTFMKLHKYDVDNELQISLVVKDRIVVSDSSKFLSQNTEVIPNASYYYESRRIGITPFSVYVTVDNTYISHYNAYFAVAGMVTAVVLGIFSFFLVAMTRKYFFLPMLKVMESVEKLNFNELPGSISYVGSEEFDRLVNRLNDMLERLDAKNKSIQKTQMMLKNTEIQKQKAIVYSLKKQINAHFTVNILNIIKILVSKKEIERAAVLCDGLSALVRYAHDEDEFINAWDEFRILQNYINIMNIRYDDKFTVNIELDDRLMGCRIPRMLLQPIIENAMMHGYGNVKQSGCVIDVEAKIINEHIEIQIRDYGDGLTAEELDKLRKKLKDFDNNLESAGGINHVALANISRRIYYYYGEGSGIVANAVNPSGLEITMTISSIV